MRVLKKGRSLGSLVNHWDNRRLDWGIIQRKGLKLRDAVYEKQGSKEGLCYFPIYIYEMTMCVCVYGFSSLFLYRDTFPLYTVGEQDKLGLTLCFGQ